MLQEPDLIDASAVLNSMTGTQDLRPQRNFRSGSPSKSRDSASTKKLGTVKRSKKRSDEHSNSHSRSRVKKRTGHFGGQDSGHIEEHRREHVKHKKGCPALASIQAVNSGLGQRRRRTHQENKA